MNSLKVKILGLISFIVVAIILAAAFINFQLQKQMISSIMEHNSMMLAETVKSSIANAMNAGRAHELQDILFTAKNRESIKSIRVIAADKLLVESRILAIADAFDAMTSDRPYRKALPLDAAIKELCDNAGSQFDPHMVPHFVELLKNGAFSFLEGFDLPPDSVPALPDAVSLIPA